jgi:hypothetical protein
MLSCTARKDEPRVMSHSVSDDDMRRCLPWAGRHRTQPITTTVNKKIAPRTTVKIEPKTFFANERTFIQWCAPPPSPLYLSPATLPVQQPLSIFHMMGSFASVSAPSGTGALDLLCRTESCASELPRPEKLEASGCTYPLYLGSSLNGAGECRYNPQSYLSLRGRPVAN